MKVNYSSSKTPEEYVCKSCGASNVKLWREYGVFHPEMLCRNCAAKDQDANISDIDEYGKFTDNDGVRSDCIRWYIPAVPDEEGVGFWGYTSVPQDGIDWWTSLPTNRVQEMNIDFSVNSKSQDVEKYLNDRGLDNKVYAVFHEETGETSYCITTQRGTPLFVAANIKDVKMRAMFMVHQQTIPSKDTVYMLMAMQHARLSKCIRAQYGAILVSADGFLVGGGYNGKPAGSINDMVCYRMGLEDNASKPNCCLHAEDNAITLTDRSLYIGGTIYVSGIPCTDCALKIAQSGLVRCVYLVDPDGPHQGNFDQEFAGKYGMRVEFVPFRIEHEE